MGSLLPDIFELVKCNDIIPLMVECRLSIDLSTLVISVLVENRRDIFHDGFVKQEDDSDIVQ